MKISQALTPAAFEFGCTSAACAPPNRKGTGGTGGSIKGHTKGGGGGYSRDRNAEVIEKTLQEQAKRLAGSKSLHAKETPPRDRNAEIIEAKLREWDNNTKEKGAGPKFKADKVAADPFVHKKDSSNDKGIVAKGTDKSNDKIAVGGRSSMKSSVDMDKSRAIAAARGDKPAGHANRDEKTGLPPGYPEPKELVDKEHRDHNLQTTGRSEVARKNDAWQKYLDSVKALKGKYPITQPDDGKETINDTYERTGGNSRLPPPKNGGERYARHIPDGFVDKATQREIDFKRAKAKFDATIPSLEAKIAARKRKANSEKLREYERMMRQRNTHT